ncbi:NAD(P)/FAD-dependent oxidoreductase [Nocardia sp. NPDC003963]
MAHDPHVLVIGGGPAGSTTAALLARAGIRVTVLEKEAFPRYHIGESLLASVLSTLRLSGAYDKVAAHGFQVKRGAHFLWKDDPWLLNWSELVDAEAWSWQVDRAEFDKILLDNAADQGAEVIEQATVKRVVFDDEGRPSAAEWVRAGDDTVRTIEFDFLVDASGRAGILAKHFNMRRMHDGFRNIGIWSYWTGARLHPDSPEGAINVVSTPEGGWFWHIPLAGGKFSVGYVVSTQVAAERLRRHQSKEAFYEAIIGETPELQELLADAEQISDVRTEQDYSYVADRLCGPGYALVGDSALFLDPLLSTGVHLATFGGLTAAASIATYLRGEMEEAQALAFHEYVYRRAYERFLSLVSRMYRDYIGSEEYFEHAATLTEERATDSPAQSFTMIMAGITDVLESDGSQGRTATATIVDEADGYHAEYGDGANTEYMGAIDMAPVWDLWRDPLGADVTMGDYRISTVPLGITTATRSAAEKAAVVRPVRPPVAAEDAPAG